jgi:hypothetical protein
MVEPVTRDYPRLALLNLGMAGGHILAALTIISVAANAGSPQLPVVLSIPSIAQQSFAAVDLAAALVVVVLISAVVRLAVALPPLRGRYESGVHTGRHGIRWIEYSQTAAITVFLVAQLNGIAEAGALILCYAIAAGAVLLLWLQDRVSTGPRGLLPFSVGAAIAVVPWGVIALYQVVALVVGQAPSILIRIMTVVLLVIAALHWLNVWLQLRRRGPWAAPLTAERAHLVLGLAQSAALVALVAVGVAARAAVAA